MSRLLDNSAQYRDALIVKNDYKPSDEYTSGHADALSDGDNKGMGEKNGSVGTITDIKTRETLLVKNKFNKNKEYNSSVA